MKKILLGLILVLALATRWYKIDNPVADWHSWRQADTASVSQEYVRNGIDLLRPKYHDQSNIPSGLDNPEGYRMVEFPHANAIHAIMAKNFTFWDLDQWGRVLSVFYSLISIIFIYLIVKTLSGSTMAYLTAFLMAVLPFNVYYSRVILPEPLMITLTLMANYYFIRFSQTKKNGFLFASAVSLSIALLTKPYAIFFTLPILYLAFHDFRVKMFKKPTFYLYAAIALIPLYLWRKHILNYPEGIPASDWLYNLNGLRLRPAWWRWLFGERIAALILGYWGTLPFALGIIKKYTKSEGPIYLLWLLGILAYLVIFAGGNVTHDYYQAIITPFLIIFLARGLTALFTPNNYLSWPLSPLLGLFVLAMSLFMSWYQIRGYYNINNWPIVEAGQRADQILPSDARVIAPYNGDTAFLYQIRRPGWPAVLTDLDKMIASGATHYVSVNYDQSTNELLNAGTHKVLEQNDRYVIIEF